MWLNLFKEVDNSKPKICPKCLLKMHREIKGNISIDICDPCGVAWINDKEIDKIIRISKLETFMNVKK